jgi:hypothetical protein
MESRLDQANQHRYDPDDISLSHAKDVLALSVFLRPSPPQSSSFSIFDRRAVQRRLGTTWLPEIDVLESAPC